MLTGDMRRKKSPRGKITYWCRCVCLCIEHVSTW